LKVLLAVTTGLRRGDIEAIRTGDIHFDRNTITTQNRKAGKAMAERPMPEQIMTELSNYVTTLPDGQERVLTDKFSPKRWEKIWKAAAGSQPITGVGLGLERIQPHLIGPGNCGRLVPNGGQA
jgi:integrase